MQHSIFRLPVRSGFEAARGWRAAGALCAAGLLASCGGYDHGNDCFGCGPTPTPTEISFGVASGDFHGAGAVDLVQISTVEPEQGPERLESQNLSLDRGRRLRRRDVHARWQ